MAAASDANVIHIIHFNDVYNINPIIKKDASGAVTNVIGGAARFQTFINTLSPLKPLILFSGDFLSPSDISTVTKGEHMVPIMNGVGITCAMIGNHDLDYGNKHCIEMLAKLKYPVLNTNIMTPSNEVATGDLTVDSKLELQPLGKCMTSYIHKYNDNCNVGILGISENWSETLPILPENGVVYLDFIQECQKRVDELKNNKDNKIDLMIVLTHSRLLNDQLLASKITGVDLICGGHDHMYFCGMHDDTKTMIVKSGTDFKNVSWLQVQLNSDGDQIQTCQQAQKIEQELSKSLNEKKGAFKGPRYTFLNRYYNIDINLKADQVTEKLVHDLSAAFQQQMGQTIGYLAAPIDCRFSTVRSQESTAGNFVADVIRRAYRCDVVFLCGGALRADRILPAGKFTYKDILDLVPFQDSIVVIKMKGSSIIKVLEHGVSGVPKADGKFPQISGLRFLYDPAQPIGQRVKKVWIERYVDERISSFAKSLSSLKGGQSPNAEQQDVEEKDAANDDDDGDEVEVGLDDEEDQMEIIKHDQVYKLATRQYIANGGDGYTVFEQETVETIVDEEAGVPMSVILRNFFWAVDSVNRLLKMSDDVEKQKEAKKRTQRFSLTPLKRATSLIAKEKWTVDGDEESDKKTESETVARYADQIRIKPQIEHRIMTVDEQVDLQSVEMQPMKQFFSRLPSFISMKHLPRRQSLMAILSEIEQENT